MKNILVLTGRYLPKMSPNGVCINNIIQNLPEDKYKVTCVCYDDYEKTQDKKVKIVRVSRGLLQSIIYLNEGKTYWFSKILIKLIHLINAAIAFFFLAIWPWNDPIYTRKVFQTVKKLHQETPFDYIIAVHMPISSLIVANKMKMKYPKIKYIPYFLDSLSGGRPISLLSEKWNRKRKLKWERRLLPNADKIVVMEASRAHHELYSSQAAYYKKFVYLDIPLLCKPQKSKREFIFPSGDLINVTFSGAALQPMRNMTFFMKLANEIHRIDDRIIFHVIGQCNCNNQFDSNCIHYYKPMPHDRLIPYLEYSDVLINFGVRVPSAISGKIFEYMAFGKPIISTYSIPNEACIPYLKRYPLALLIKESDEKIVEVARTTVDFIHRSIGKNVEISEIKKLFCNNLPETFIKEILEKEEL